MKQTLGKDNPLTRRELLAVTGAAMSARAATGESGNYLLINATELAAAGERTARLPWAKSALARLLQQADATLAQPLDVPSKGGQWGHWYVCKKDGTALTADSPIRHRCPRCGEVYTGYPYDEVYLTRIHGGNSAAMRDLGLAFRLTGKRAYAERVRELLLAYARQYRRYAHRDNLGQDSVNAGRVMSTTLDESTWTIPAAWGYALVKTELPAADRKTVEEELLRPLTDTIIGTSYSRLPNIQCWKDSAIACVGFAIGDPDLVAEALDHPVRGFHAVMKRYVMPGGLWYEGSLGYHHYTLSALWPLAEAARHNGLDLYQDARYRSMFEAPLALSMQDGSSPGFNDHPGGTLATYSDLYEIAFARWGDQRHGRAAAEGPRTSLVSLLYGADTLPDRTRPLIPSTSVLLKEAGYAVLRSREVTAAVRFGLHGSGHGHPDKLNVVTSAFGQVFGLDPGSVNYGAPLHGEWYRSTIAHNTVCVDGALQSATDGELIDWQSGQPETRLSAVAKRVYPGVSLKRDLSLQAGELRDRFECDSATEHTYDWAFHAVGTLSTSLQLEARGSALGTTNGYQHISDVRQGQTGQDWWVRWQNGGTSLTLHVEGAPGTQVITGVGPGREAADRVPVVIVRRRATRTVFAARHVYEQRAQGAR